MNGRNVYEYKGYTKHMKCINKLSKMNAPIIDGKIIIETIKLKN